MSLRCQSEQQAEGSGIREASMSPLPFLSHTNKVDTDDEERSASGSSNSPRSDAIEDSENEIDYQMDTEVYAGSALSEKTVKPLTPEALAAFNVTQARSGVIYISRIPPGMQPAKVRHLLSQYGEVGRVYLQQEGENVGIMPSMLAKDWLDAKTAYLRRKYTTTKKPHFVEGWVEFKDKQVARSVAGMLNAQPIGGKKGTRWRDDVWTMKYLPKFKWNMLTEQIGRTTSILIEHAVT